MTTAATTTTTKKKIQSISGFSVSAILRNYDAAALGKLWKKSFHSLSLHSAAVRVASLKCRLGGHQWEFAMIVFVLLLLLHWALGSAEWAEGQKHSEGDDPWASCHTSNTEGERERYVFPEIAFYSSFLRCILYRHWQSVTFLYMCGRPSVRPSVHPSCLCIEGWHRVSMGNKGYSLWCV